MNENNANFTNFHSEELTNQGLDHGQNNFIRGVFDDPEKVVSIVGNYVTSPQAAREEGDTFLSCYM